MKALLPVLFFITLSVSALANNAGPFVPQPEFNSYADNSYTVIDSVGCQTKTAFFFDDTNWGPQTPVSYTWDFGDGNISTVFDSQPTHTYTAPGIYSVTMTVVTNLGKTFILTKPGYIIVGSSFSVNLGPDTALCGSAPLTLDATTVGASYLWSSGSVTPTITDTLTNGPYSVAVTRNGCVAKDTVNITRTILSVDLGPDQELCDGSTLTLSLSGDYTGADILWNTGETTSDIMIWDGGQYYVSVTKNGCSASDSVYITWKPEIALNFGFQKVGGCLPVDMKFTDSSTACSGSIVGWAWDFGDGSTSTLQNPTHTFTTRGQFPVRLTVTASSGSTVSQTKKVTINPPTVSVDLGPDTTICFGESVMLDAANPGAVYTWNTGDTTQQITVYDDGAYGVTVDVNGCTATDTVNVRTTASVSSDFGYTIGGNCLPVTVNFSDSSVAFCGQSIVSYKWSFGDGSISTQRNPVHVYNTADSFNVRLTVTSSNGNTATRTRKITITNTSFTVNIPAGLTVCRGGTVNLDAVVTGAQYAWSPSFGLTATNIRNPVLTPVQNSWYTVAVTKCSITQTDSVYITMDSVAKPVIVQEGNSLKSPDAATYQWFFADKPINGGVTKALRMDKAGYYSLKIVNGNGCTNQSDEYFFIPVSGYDKNINGYRMKISPNPARGMFNILLSDIPLKAATVTIYDASGKRMLVTTIQDHVNTINAMKFSKGLYFVEILINTGRTIMPVVIQ